MEFWPLPKKYHIEILMQLFIHTHLLMRTHLNQDNLNHYQDDLEKSDLFI